TLIIVRKLKKGQRLNNVGHEKRVETAANLLRVKTLDYSAAVIKKDRIGNLSDAVFLYQDSRP
ncbi:MAG TPA: hypothetical protein VEQ40_11785, partial [Pyrinomonadaceae bacterium]|nr:hypothetical protein [Pyrinomonadaceae bacterium]